MPISLQLPALFEYQWRPLYSPARLAFIEGSSKCGKTFPCIIRALDVACRLEPNQAVWWVAPIAATAKIAFDRLLAILTKLDPLQSWWSCNLTERWVELKGSGKIWFKGADNPDSLYGEDVFEVIVDEASRVKEEAWVAIMSTLTATNGAARVIGNVKGRKTWFWRMCRLAEQGEPDMVYAKITADDAVRAGLLKQSVLDLTAKTMTKGAFRQLFHCEPDQDEGNPFGYDHIKACTGPMGAGPPAAFGVDLADKQDFTVVVGLNARGQVCYFDRWHKTGWELTETRITSAVKGAPAYADCAGLGDVVVERLQRACKKLEGFNTATKKIPLINGLAADIQQGKLQFPEGPIRVELDAYEYQPTKTGRVGFGAPDGLHDDCVTALALAALRLDAHRNVSPVYVSMGEPVNRIARLVDDEAMWSD